MAIDLKDKTILITGASAGIGRACALVCSEAGAEVILTGRNELELSKTRSLLKGKSEIVVADISKEEDIISLVEKTKSLNGFIHCAGIIKPLPIKYIKKAEIETLFGINFNSAVLICSKLLQAKKINEKASLVFVSSVSARHPYTGGALYTASKAALEAFSRGLALEGAIRKIRSNVLAPALVSTRILEETFSSFTAEEREAIHKQYPLGIGEPEDVANAALFLLSDASKWITGQTIDMDGGLLLNSKK